MVYKPTNITGGPHLPYVHEDILIYMSNLFYPLGNDYNINIVEYVPNIPNVLIKQ